MHSTFGDAAALDTGDAPDLERGRREQAAGVAERNHGVGFAFADQFRGAGDGAVAFFAERAGGFFVHLHDFAGVNDAHAMVAETALGQRGVDFVLVADEKEGGDVLVVFQRLFDAGNDDATAVVAPHDIHCNSHRMRKIISLNRKRNRAVIFSPAQNPEPTSRKPRQAPAVTLKTWRPL